MGGVDVTGDNMAALFFALTAGNILIPGMVGTLPGIHSFSALTSSLLVWGFAVGVATFGYFAAKRI